PELLLHEHGLTEVLLERLHEWIARPAPAEQEDVGPDASGLEHRDVEGREQRRIIVTIRLDQVLQEDPGVVDVVGDRFEFTGHRSLRRWPEPYGLRVKERITHQASPSERGSAASALRTASQRASVLYWMLRRPPSVVTSIP